jgi:hypothetical protein
MSAPSPQPSTRLPRLAPALAILALVTLVGAGLRVATAWNQNRRWPDDASRLAGDECGYEGLGYDLTQGYFFLWPGRVPVYPMFVAATYKLVGARSPAAVLYAQAGVSALAVPLTFWLARRFMRQSMVAPLLAASIVAVDPALISYVRWMYTEAIYTPLLVLTTIALCSAAAGGTQRGASVVRSIASGIMLAVLNLTRATGGLMPGLLLIASRRTLSIKQRVAASLVCGVAMAVCIAPWTWHNYRTYGRFLPLAPSTAVLWQGCPEYYHLVKTKSYERIWHAELNPRVNGGHDPFSIDGDRYFTQRAIRSILAEPMVYAKYCLKKAAYFWVGNTLSEYSYAQVMHREPLRDGATRFDWLCMVIGRNFAFVGLTALLVLFVRRRAAAYGMLLAIVGYFWLVHTLTATEIRFSLPLHPLLAVLIAGAVVRGRHENVTSTRASV